MSGRLVQAVADSALDAGGAALDAVVTISARLPILARCAVLPSADGMAEWEQACSEKVSAAWEGGVAALAGWNAMLVNALFAPMTPAGFAHDTVAVLRAAAAPAHDRVRANALRLSRSTT